MDAYLKLIEALGISEEKFAEIGMSNFLPIESDVKKKQWEVNKEKLFTENAELYIRSYGQRGKNTKLYLELYKNMFNCKIVVDPNNNKYPSQTLKRNTAYRKNSKSTNPKFTPIFNYQISHLFGRTKNPVLFTALWNLAYIPRYFDPFTGHESKGQVSDGIRDSFKRKVIEENEDFIRDYNNFFSDKIESLFMPAFEKVVKEFSLDESQKTSFYTDAFNELRPINIETIIDN